MAPHMRVDGDVTHIPRTELPVSRPRAVGQLDVA